MIIENNTPPETPSDSSRPFHAKRPHKKSRAGCKDCKARKVKCDEARPSCRSCKLRNTPCIYSEEETMNQRQQHACLSRIGGNGKVASVKASRSTTREHLIPFVVSEPQFRPGSIDEIDMKLLWFYTTNTCGLFNVAGRRWNKSEGIMRGALVQQAFQTPFLMDSLFSVSTLHLQILNQKFDQNRALMYRARSFEGYRKAIQVGDHKTFPALVANSLLLTAISSQNFREPTAPDLYIIDWMVVWRGIGLMLDLITLPGLLESGLEALFFRPQIDLEIATTYIPDVLLSMISSIEPTDPEYVEVPVYLRTLKYLGSLHHHLRDGLNPVMRLRIITFFTFLPTRFQELVREKRPLTLIILAHYATFLKFTQYAWWLVGIADRTISDIIKYLDPEWLRYMAMPVKVLAAIGDVSVGQLILNNDLWNPTGPLHSDNRSKVLNLAYVDDAGRGVQVVGDNIVVVDPDASGEEPVWYS